MSFEKKNSDEIYNGFVSEGFELARDFVNSYNYTSGGERFYAIEKVSALIEVFAEIKMIMYEYYEDDNNKTYKHPDEHNLKGFEIDDIYNTVGKMLMGQPLSEDDGDFVKNATQEALDKARYTTFGDLEDTLEALTGASVIEKEDNSDCGQEANVLASVHEDTLLKILGNDSEACTDIITVIKAMRSKSARDNAEEISQYIEAKYGSLKNNLTDEEIEELCRVDRSKEQQELIDEVNEEAVDDFFEKLSKRKRSDK